MYLSLLERLDLHLYVTIVSVIVVLFTSIIVFLLIRLNNGFKLLKETSTSRFNNIIDRVEVGILLFNAKTGELMYMNRLMHNITDEIDGDKLIKRIQSLTDKTQLVKDKIDSLVDKVFSHDFAYNNKWYECRNTLINWGRDQFVNFNVVFDITSRMEHEHALERAQNELKNLIQELPVGIVIMNKEDQTEYTNNAFLELFGLVHSKGLINKNLFKVLQLKKIHNKDDVKDAGGEKYFYKSDHGAETIVYHKQLPTFSDGKTQSINTFVNITAIEEARKAELFANKAKSEFLGKISHELRTPLSSIVGITDVLLGTGLNTLQRENALTIKQSSDVLHSILNNLLDLSKVDSGKIQLEEIPFKLRDELRYTAESYLFKAKENNVSIEIYIPNNVKDNFIGDPFRIRQVLSYLVSQSLKTTTNGKIVIGASFIREVYDTIILMFYVSDTGDSIRKDVLNKLFDSESSEIYADPNLDTSTILVKKLVEMMDGELWADSPSGLDGNNGVKYCFTADLIGNERVVKQIGLKSVIQPKQLKVLIVKPESERVDTLHENFKTMGMPVLEAYSKSEAMEVINTQPQRERVKVIFLADTPTFDGFKIATDFDNMGVAGQYLIVMLSSNHIKGNYTKAKKLRIDHYIVLPYQSSEIENIIKDNFPSLQLDTGKKIDSQSLNTNLSILLAEDNIINQKVAQSIFKSIGYEIEIAENGNMAIERMQTKHYDIVFMDFLMPIKDGLEATVELRMMGYNQPIIAMTANAGTEDMLKATQVGMNDFVSKPFLVGTIKNMLIKWASNTD